MTVKATWLFNGRAFRQGRVWGFSESWYSNSEGDGLLAAMDLVSTRRVQILSKDTRIVGYRIGVTGGRSYVVRRTFDPPGNNDFSNMPVDAALCQCGIAGSPSRKKFFFHDLPDDWVNSTLVEAIRRPAINLVMQTLAATGFMVRFQNQAALTAPILSIDALGAVTLAAPAAFAVGNIVSFLSTRDVNNRAIRGSYVITVATDATHFTVAHWPGNVVGRSGRVRLNAFTYGAATYLGDDTVIQGGSRKVGRPFFQFRGRRPVRR